ncbi:hypothetical protein Tco_0052414 [Tanacetum coccineum]
MCKAYGGEPSLDMLRAFLNLGPASDWLNLSNRGGSGIPKALTKLITHIEGWKGSFFFIKNKIVSSKYPKLLFEENKLGKKSFKDLVPLRLKSFWKHSLKKPIICHCGREMNFRSFMVEGSDGEFHFKLEGGVGDVKEESSSNRPVNNEAPVIDVNPLNSALHSHVAENVRDSDDVSSEKGVVDEAERLRKSLKAIDSDPDIHEFPSAKELKDFTDCHFVVAHVTPPSWKQHLRDISLGKLCDIHDRVYMRQAILDNMLNSRTRQLMSALTKATASCDVIWEREIEKDKAYAELERKCNDALQDLDKNPLVLDMRVEIETLQGQEIDKLRQDRDALVTKVIPHAATKLIRSDEVGLLVARLIKAAIFRGRCIAFKEVAILKDPFTLEKMPSFRSSFEKEFNQADDELATASYPFISEDFADLYASLEELLSKKPRSDRSKFTSS